MHCSDENVKMAPATNLVTKPVTSVMTILGVVTNPETSVTTILCVVTNPVLWPVPKYFFFVAHDHLAINYSFELETLPDDTILQTENTLNSGNPNFDNPLILNFYQSKVEEKLAIEKNKLSEKNTQDQKYIDDFYENLCSIFVKSSEEAFLFQNTVLVSKNSETNKNKKTL